MRCTKPFENTERFFFLSNLCNLCKSRNAIPGSQIARNINAKKINDSLSCQFRVTSTCTFALSKSLIPGPNLTSSCHLKYTWLQNSSICISSHFFFLKTFRGIFVIMAYAYEQLLSSVTHIARPNFYVTLALPPGKCHDISCQM